MDNKTIRQPIVCVLGHVDHGKTSILDAIRGTAQAKKEAGGITQRIGATQIDVSAIIHGTKNILTSTSLKIPGLLFIDTPGHVAFANMRARGGALADIAILVVDVNEGLMPQTIESINILKKYKTPFVIVANKIDLVPLVTETSNTSFSQFIKKQREEYREELDRRIYDLVNAVYLQGFPSDRFDRVTDFSKTIAIIPASAKLRIGIQDILMMLAGLSQRYLEKEISMVNGEARGTIIEVKIESSVGTTLDTILYQGALKTGDVIAINTKEGPKLTRVKALLVNSTSGEKGLKEKRIVSAAAGVRILISDKYEVIAGSPLIAVTAAPEAAFLEIEKESRTNIDLSTHGITVKAEALGSLEAIAYELSQRNILIRSATIGDITRRDATDVATLNDPMERLIIGFNVTVTDDAREAVLSTDVGILVGNIIYSLMDQAEKWLKDRETQIREARKQEKSMPAKITIMPENIFRATKPVIVGVHIEGGSIKVGDKLIKSDGRYGGSIKSIRDGELSKKFAEAPSEVAVAIDGVTLNRQIFPGETLYVDIPESVVKELRESNADAATMSAMDETIKIKRKENIFWGTRA
ncbi:MAG: translation initiation factor IF-2 [Candidatus Thermoplasmatota archaeon]|jgi:translation initiation factor 5B|nr:translation initiation factor IF-2 [Candidatus Thermoplasmatota archaeon]